MSNTPYQELYNYAYSLASNYHEVTRQGYYTDWNKIPDEDKEALAGLFINYDDRDLFSIYENENYEDIVSSLLTMLRKGDHDSEEDFAQCLKKNLVKYYEKKMVELLTEATADYEKHDYELNGFERCYHKDNGEAYWSKRL